MIDEDDYSSNFLIKNIKNNNNKNNKYLIFEEKKNNINIENFIEYIKLHKDYSNLNKKDKNINYLFQKNLFIHNNKTNNNNKNKNKSSNTNYISDIEKNYLIKYEYTSNEIETYKILQNNIISKIKQYKNITSMNNNNNILLLNKLSEFKSKQTITETEIFLPENNITHNFFIFLLSTKIIPIKFTNNIININFSNNNLRDTGGCYLLSLCKLHCFFLTRLNLSNTSINKNSIIIINEILSFNNLQSLNLNDNLLGDENINELLVGATYNNSLNFLYIKNNNIGYLSAIMFEKYFKYGNNLKCLDISSNLFKDETLQPIFNSLKYTKTLQILNCSDNYLTNKCLIDININLEKNNTLKILFLEKNNFNKRSICLIESILNSKHNSIEYLIISENNYKINDFNKFNIIKIEELIYNFIDKNYLNFDNKIFIDDIFNIFF